MPSCDSSHLNSTPLSRNRLVHGTVSFGDIVLLTWTIGLSASLAVGILLGWHIFLILTNQVELSPHSSLSLVDPLSRQPSSFTSTMKTAMMREPTDFFIATLSIKGIAKIFDDFLVKAHG